MIFVIIGVAVMLFIIGILIKTIGKYILAIILMVALLIGLIVLCVSCGGF